MDKLLQEGVSVQDEDHFDEPGNTRHDCQVFRRVLPLPHPTTKHKVPLKKKTTTKGSWEVESRSQPEMLLTALDDCLFTNPFKSWEMVSKLPEWTRTIHGARQHYHTLATNLSPGFLHFKMRETSEGVMKTKADKVFKATWHSIQHIASLLHMVIVIILVKL